MTFGLPNPWTPERVELLKKLWAGGYSGSIIAERMGITRNAVLGKADRLSLNGRKEGRAPRHHRPLNWETRAAGANPNRRKTIAKANGHGPERPVPATDAEVPFEQRRHILNLTSSVCHYPIGDPAKPDFFFCGAPATDRPYCQTHAKICHTQG